VVWLSVIQIVEVALLLVRFPFKTQVPIRFLCVPTPNETDSPFQNIPKVKWNNQHLDLLAQVNAFVIDQAGIFLQLDFLKQDKGP